MSYNFLTVSVPLDRPQLQGDWANLAALTVVAAFPGWGRTSFLRQCQQHLEKSSPSISSFWFTHEVELKQFLLQDLPEAPARSIFIDDVIDAMTDTLWLNIASHLRNFPSDKFIVSSIDPPPQDLTSEFSVRLVTETDLRFTKLELQILIATTAVPQSDSVLQILSDTLQGYPVLCIQYLQSIVQLHPLGHEPPMDPAAEVTMFHYLATHRRIQEMQRSQLFQSFLPLGINSHRILVTGERITPTPIKDIADMGKDSSVPGFPWWVVIIGVALVGIAVFVWRSGFSDAKNRDRIRAKKILAQE